MTSSPGAEASNPRHHSKIMGARPLNAEDNMENKKRTTYTDEQIMNIALARLGYDLDEKDEAKDSWLMESLREVEEHIAKQYELGVMYTEAGANNEHTLQVSYDLQELRLIGYLDEEPVIVQQFDSIEDLADDIRCNDWEEYYSWISDTPEVTHVGLVEDLECEVCYLFNARYNPSTAADLVATYIQRSGDREEFSQGRAGDWCIEHNDDLGDARLRDALNAYYRETKED